MTAVFIIRHPETTWNAAKRYQGRMESPLSSQGVYQADMLCRAFAGSTLDAVYTSPLHRAHSLAEKLSQITRSTLYVDNRLTEIGQCPWEGLHLPEIEQRYADLYRAWYETPDTVTFPDGECLTDVRDRALSLLEDVFRRHPSGRVAVVSHSVVIMMFVCAALNLDVRNVHNIHVSNVGVTLLCGQSAPGRLLELNDTTALYRTLIERAEAQECASSHQGQVTQ